MQLRRWISGGELASLTGRSSSTINDELAPKVDVATRHSLLTDFVKMADLSATNAATPAYDAPYKEEPDMVAVYILLGCLTVSGVVIVSLFVYCMAQCWRQRCAGRSPTRTNSRPHSFTSRVPTIKISGASTSQNSVDGYLTMAHCRMNGQPPWMERGGGGSSPGSPTGIHSSQKQPLLPANEEDTGAEDDGRDGEAHWQKAALSGSGAVSPAAAPRHNGHAFHFANPNAVDGFEVVDDEDEDFDRKSVMHYELGFYEKTHSSCFRGTLTFALRYDFIHRVLMVHVIRANHLPAKDRSGSSCDPYVKMYLLPERRNHCKTKINKKTLDPEFNEMFSFDVPFNSLAHRMLQFTVYDFDRFTRHDLTGNVIMRDLFEKSDLYSWTEYTMQIVGSNEKNDFGDLLLYLTYSVAEQKLIVTVAKAYNLRPMDITGASDPYVKVEQTYQGRRVKMRRTTTKRANLNPVYHETLEFDLPIDQIDRTNLLIQVMDWDRIGRDDLLGCCVLGADSPTAEGREQWRECFSMLGTPSQLSPPDRDRSTNAHNNQLGVSERRDAIDTGNSRKPKSVGKWHSILDEVPDNFRHITKTKK